MKKYTVGITGGIASGKTAASEIIERLGGYIVDADVVSREITATGGAAEKELQAAFPSVYKNGLLDRILLRNLVFADAAKRKKLNSITHPIIEKEIKRRITEYNGSVVFLVVPLLFETGYEKMCDYVVSVIANEEKRIERLKKRNNTITDEVARGIIGSQSSDTQKAALSDEVILNDGDLSDLEAKVTEFYYRITTRSGK